jgi:hypothetical protein
MPLIQSLLAERLHLRMHRETRELPIYSLVVGKSGPKLQATTAATGPTWSKTPGLLTGQKISMEMFATIFFWKQSWIISGSRAGSCSHGPSLFTAIQEQLGLKLTSTRGPVESLVIKSAEKPENRPAVP